MLVLCVYSQRDKTSPYSVALIAAYWIEVINLDESEKFVSRFGVFFSPVSKSTDIILKTPRRITVPETTYITHYVVIRLFRELD